MFPELGSHPIAQITTLEILTVLKKIEARGAKADTDGGHATAGVIKDVVMRGGYQELDFDFVADNPEPAVFHCHRQLHMDLGFMARFKYA